MTEPPDRLHRQLARGILMHLRMSAAAPGARVTEVSLQALPGRHEPGTGEVDFPALLSALDMRGYAGATGLEYVPRGDTLTGLGWLADPAWPARPRPN